jgi:DnaJ-class molecular chaperone
MAVPVGMSGHGKIISCSDCRGSGRVRATHTLSLKIPAGVETRSRLIPVVRKRFRAAETLCRY